MKKLFFYPLLAVMLTFPLVGAQAEDGINSVSLKAKEFKLENFQGAHTVYIPALMGNSAAGYVHPGSAYQYNCAKPFKCSNYEEGEKILLRFVPTPASEIKVTLTNTGVGQKFSLNNHGQVEIKVKHEESGKRKFWVINIKDITQYIPNNRK